MRLRKSLVHQHQDTVSEWLRRWTRNPLGSARKGSNPFGVDLLHHNQWICIFRSQGFAMSQSMDSAATQQSVDLLLAVKQLVDLLCHHQSQNSNNATPKGFEPLRAEPNGFLVHLLSHSDTVSWALISRKFVLNVSGHDFLK